ncbi:MAG: DUF2480 family protein [Riemerella sp.]|nr:DUF2480 family protein [Riemerella sp.]
MVNKVANSGLINFDISDLIPKGTRKGIDLKDFLFEGLILREADFRQKISEINPEDYKEAYVYIYNSAEAVIPLWAYFLITTKISGFAEKIISGNRETLETILLHDVIQSYDFSYLEGKRVLVKGCSHAFVSENSYVELVDRLRPVVKSLMFGEACSNVPIFKQ